MKQPRFLLCWAVLFSCTFLFSPHLLQAAVVADSEADFTTAGEQGAGGWSYGYRVVEDGDDRATYDPKADFKTFTEDDGWTWNGASWDWAGGNVPWTQVAAASGHPNGSNNDEEQWVIRRWEAQVASVTPMAINWHLHKTNTNGGNGTSVSVHFNGERIDFGAVEGSDGDGIDSTVYANVGPGDIIDVALTPEGPDEGTGDGSDGSVWTVVFDNSVPGNATQPDGSPFVPANSEDSDGDGLPDGWEERFFPGDLSMLSANGDADSDGLTDAQEFANATEPNNEDTDDDGLKDGVEDGTENYVSAEMTGSNPRVADSDGDGLSDGAEVNGDPLTNPNDEDTDGDGESDGVELTQGTDPSDSGDNFAALVEGILQDKIADSVDEFGEEQGADGWVNGYRNYTADGGGEDYDPEVGFILYPEDNWTGDAWDLDSPAGNPPWTLQGAEVVHPNGTNSGGVEHWPIRRWIADEIDSPTPLAFVWTTAEQNLNGSGVSGSLHVNGVQVDTAAVAGGDDVGVTRIYYVNVSPGDKIDLAITPVGPGGNRADSSDGSRNALRISTSLPDNPRQPNGDLFVPATGSDSDNDGLPDTWEYLFFPDDLSQLAGDADKDGDTLNDRGEFDRLTDPTNVDTDGDGLNDSVEAGDGKFVSATQTGTSPLKKDTDGDGLEDGVEVAGNPATNPNKSDSDEDGFTDAEEIADGFDPNDAGSNKFATLVANSVDEFSGVQGENGWVDGYRDLGEAPDEAPVDYNPDIDFIPYPNDWWTGVQWDEPNEDGDNIPWTTIGPENGHPNGTNSGGFEEWAIRRWVADELQDPTALALNYELRAQNVNGGNGTTVQLHINGILQDSLAVEGRDGVGEQRTFYANVNPGDAIDLALTPVGPDEGRADGSDGSFFSLRIDSVIPDNPVQPDGSSFEPVVLGDPSLTVPFRSPFGELGDSPGTQERSITLKNSGNTQELIVTSITSKGSDADHYQISGVFLPLTLAPGATQDLIVSFDPQGGDGGFDAVLEFVSDDENQPTRTLDLSALIPDPNKLLAWYKMDDSAGTQMRDASGNGYHGIFVSNGGASVTLGEPGLAGGTAARFAASGEDAAYGQVAGFPAFEGPFTISVWSQADDDLGPVAGLISKSIDENSDARPYALAAAGGLLNWFGDGVPDIQGGDASAVVADQAQHFAVTYALSDNDGFPTVHVYVDGVLTETSNEASEIIDVSAPLQLGAVNSQFGFSGLLDDIQIYGKVASAEEIQQLFVSPGVKLGGSGRNPEPNPDPTANIANVTITADSITIGVEGITGAFDVEFSETLQSWEIIASGVNGASFSDNDATRRGLATGYYRLRTN